MAFDPYTNNDKIMSILKHVRIARVLSIATFDRVKKDHLNPRWPLSSQTIIGNRIFPDHHTILINSINLEFFPLGDWATLMMSMGMHHVCILTGWIYKFSASNCS